MLDTSDLGGAADDLRLRGRVERNLAVVHGGQLAVDDVERAGADVTPRFGHSHGRGPAAYAVHHGFVAALRHVGGGLIDEVRAASAQRN